MDNQVECSMLSEGTSDLVSLEEICQRLASEYGLSLAFDEKLSKPANGPISKQVVKLRTALFKSSDIKVAFYFADADKGNYRDKLRKIKGYIKDYDETWLSKSVIGIPDRNLEEWLMTDEDNVKKHLGLNHNAPLPHLNIRDSKERLIRLVSEYGDDSLTPATFRLLLASTLDTRALKHRSHSFQAFCDDFGNKMNNIS